MCCSVLCLPWFRRLVVPAHLAVFGGVRLAAGASESLSTRGLNVYSSQFRAASVFPYMLTETCLRGCGHLSLRKLRRPARVTERSLVVLAQGRRIGAASFQSSNAPTKAHDLNTRPQLWRMELFATRRPLPPMTMRDAKHASSVSGIATSPCQGPENGLRWTKKLGEKQDEGPMAIKPSGHRVTNNG
jgi:hypothetical protein